MNSLIRLREAIVTLLLAVRVCLGATDSHLRGRDTAGIAVGRGSACRATQGTTNRSGAAPESGRSSRSRRTCHRIGSGSCFV